MSCASVLVELFVRFEAAKLTPGVALVVDQVEDVDVNRVQSLECVSLSANRKYTHLLTSLHCVIVNGLSLIRQSLHSSCI